ncbi:MAG: hypothetical protein ACRERC_15645 [Candidatus Binatia bacterium]
MLPLNDALTKQWAEMGDPKVTPTRPGACQEAARKELEGTHPRKKEIDASIAAKAENEYLSDRPYDEVGVVGPFTVESFSPHHGLGVDENGEVIDAVAEASPECGAKQSFPQMILENLKTAGVQQAHKEDRISFTALTPWPGELVCAEGRAQRHFASVRQAEERPHRREGDQPPRRRDDEGFPGMNPGFMGSLAEYT